MATSGHRQLLIWLVASSLASFASSACSSIRKPLVEDDASASNAMASCPPPLGNEPRVDFDGAPLVVLCHTVYVEPATTEGERDLVKRWVGEARGELTSVFGPAQADPPAIVVCASRSCAVTLSGPTGRSRATMSPRPTIYVNRVDALTRGTIVHEMIHIELHRRRTAASARRDVPTWFEEGVATFVGDNGFCPAGTPLAIDDLRKLDESPAWTSYTNQQGKLDPTYCQARDEVAAWVGQRGRTRRALVELLDAVYAGASFDELYGPLVRPGASQPAP